MTRLPLLALFLVSMSSLGAENQQVVLRLFVPESTICKGLKEVQVRVEVQNVGSAPVAIDLAAVGSGFDAIACTEPNQTRLGSKACRSPATRLLDLQDALKYSNRGLPTHFVAPLFWMRRFSRSRGSTRFGQTTLMEAGTSRALSDRAVPFTLPPIG